MIRLSEERAVWFADNRERHIIVAARIGNNDAFSKKPRPAGWNSDSAMDAGRPHEAERLLSAHVH